MSDTGKIELNLLSEIHKELTLNMQIIDVYF